MGDNEVLIKIAADISQAVSALSTLIEQFSSIGDALKTVDKGAETTDQQFTKLLENIQTAIVESSATVATIGQKLSDAVDTIGAAMDTTKTTAAGVSDALTTTAGASETAAAGAEKFGAAAAAGAGEANEALSTTKETAAELSEEFSGKLAPAAETATGSLGPLFDGIDEGAQGAVESTEAASEAVGGLAESVTSAAGEQLSFNENVDAGTTATWGLAEAVTDLAQQEEEAAAQYASFTDEQKAKTAELTAALLEEGMAFADIAEKAGLSEEALKLLTAEQDELAKKIKEAEDAAKPFWQTWLDGVSEGEAATVTWGVVLADVFKTLGEGVANAAKALPAMVGEMAAVGDEIYTMSQRTGVAKASLGELQYLADQSGANFAGLAKTVQNLGKSLVDESSKGAVALEGMGMNVAALKAQKPEEAFYNIVKSLQQIPDQAERNAKALEVFGNRFAQNLPLLNETIEGNEGLRAAYAEMAEGRDLEKLADQGDRYGDALNDIKLKQQVFKESIANAVLGPVTDVLEKMPLLGGAVLTVGEGFMSAAGAMLPMAGQLAMLGGKDGLKGLFDTVSKGMPSLSGISGMFTNLGGTFMKLVAPLGAMVTSLGGISGIFAALTGPIGLTVLAVGALGVALYKLMGGWEGIKAALAPVIQLFSDLYVIAMDLAEKAFGALVEIVGEVVTWFSELYDWTVKLAVDAFNYLVEVVQDVFAWMSKLPIVGPMIDVISQAWQTLFGWVGKAYEVVAGFGKMVGGVFKGAVDYISGWAGSIREANKEGEKTVATNAAVAASTAPVVSGMDRMLAKAKEVDKVVAGLNATQKAQIKTLLDSGASSKDIAEVMKKELRVGVDVATKAIDKFKKGLEDAKKAADKDPFKKLMEEAKELGSALDKAATAGTPMSVVLETMGKKAADMAAAARLVPGAFEKLPPKIKEIGDAWNTAQLAEKTDALNKKVKELAEAYSDKLTAGAKAASDAIQTMQDDMTAAYLTGAEARAFALEREQKKAVEAVQTQKTEAAKAADDQVQKIHDTYEANAKEIEKLTTVDKAERDRRLADLKREEDAAVVAAEAAAAAQQEGLDQQLTQLGVYYADKKALDAGESKDFEANARARGLTTKKASEDELKVQTEKLTFMRANEDKFTKDQIAAQATVVDAATNTARNMGLVTKQSAELELKTQQDKLAFMQANTDKFTYAQIAAQKTAVDAAEVGAGKMKVDWGGALSSITDAFEQLANIAGGTFGGMLKGIGEVAGGLNVMKDSFGGVKKMFGEAGGMKGIAGSFGSMAKPGAGGIGGLVGSLGGLMKGIGTIMPMAGAVIAGVTAAIGVGKKLWDAFTTSKGEKAAKEVGKKFGVTITEEMGDKIAKTAKDMFKGDSFTAEIYHLDEIIKAAGGVTAKNFDKLAGNLGETFKLVKQGKMTADQAREVMDKNFGAFADHVLKSGKVASKEFQNIVKQNAESGVKSQEIINFVAGQTERMGSALTAMMGPQAKALEEYKSKAGGILDKMKGLKEGTAEYAAAQQELNKINAETGGLFEKAGGKMERFERLAVAGFNSAVKAGVPMLDALDQMGPAFDSIIAQNQALGREGGAAISELLKFREVAGANKELVESAGSLNEMMLALSNTGALNTETMADLQAQGAETFDQLIAAGFTEQQSLQQMKGFLEQTRTAHKELGLPIDENTQKLIAQAESQGVLAKEQMSTNDIMLTGLGAIIEALGGKLPDAFKKMSDAGVGAAKTVGDTMNASVGTAIDGTSAKLNATPWNTYAAKGVAAGTMAGGAVKGVDGAVDAVAGSLESTDWSGWSQEAVDAAAAAEEAINGVSLGHSPGGIKEIPIKLREAMRAFREWEKVGIISAGKVKDAVEAGLGAGEGMIESNLAMKHEAIAKIDNEPMKLFADEQMKQTADLSASVAELAAQAAAAVPVNFTIQAMDGADVRRVVEEKIQPAIMESWKRGRGITALKEVVGG